MFWLNADALTSPATAAQLAVRRSMEPFMTDRMPNIIYFKQSGWKFDRNTCGKLRWTRMLAKRGIHERIPYHLHIPPLWL